MQLKNTMPVLHLKDSDTAALREIFASCETAGQGRLQGNNLPDQPAQPGSEPGGVTGPLENIPAKRFPTSAASGEYEVVPLQGGRESLGPLDEYTPFLTAVTEWGESSLKAECRLSVYEDNFLRHHTLSGRVSEDDPGLIALSCAPLTVSLEIMAEACVLLAGSTRLTVIENVKALDWVALDDGEVCSKRGLKPLVRADSGQVCSTAIRLPFQPNFPLKRIGERMVCPAFGTPAFPVG